MHVIKKTIIGSRRSDTYEIYPIGDIHIGNVNCDEHKLDEIIEMVKSNNNARWIGMGDYCDFINMKDKRFSVKELASWITIKELTDLAKYQMDRIIRKFQPISEKCLCLVRGNHEDMIQRMTERDVHSNLVSAIKENGKLEVEERLDLGYYGWLPIVFTRDQSQTRVTLNIHHGMVGGMLAGAKALAMQRWLWSHDADIVIFGHSHNTGIQVEQTEYIDQAGKFRVKKKYGCYAGTFMKPADESSSYAEIKGYLPIPQSNIKIVIRPFISNREDGIISIVTGI